MKRIASLCFLVVLGCAGSATAQFTDAAAPFCSHGTAVQGQCLCQPGYEKDGTGACNIATFATNCVHGVAVAGSCQCNVGFDKDGTGACSIATTTAAASTAPQTQQSDCGHGYSVLGYCLCQRGYTKDDATDRCTLQGKK